MSDVASAPLIDPFGDPQATYVQVAEVIAARIESGVYTDRLPSERALANEFGVAYLTLRHAMQLLRLYAVLNDYLHCTVAGQVAPGARVVYMDNDRCKSGCAHAESTGTGATTLSTHRGDDTRDTFSEAS